MAAKICLTDSVLILFITVAQLCAYAIWRGNRSWAVMLVMAVMCGLGVMIKRAVHFLNRQLHGCGGWACSISWTNGSIVGRLPAWRVGTLSPVLGEKG